MKKYVKPIVFTLIFSLLFCQHAYADVQISPVNDRSVLTVVVLGIVIIIICIICYSIIKHIKNKNAGK